MTTVMQYDGENNPDVLAMIAAFAADAHRGPALRDHPGRGAHGPRRRQARGLPRGRGPPRGVSRLDLVVSGHKNGLCMVESSAKELAEEEMIDALTEAHEIILQIVDLADELVRPRRQGADQVRGARPSTRTCVPRSSATRTTSWTPCAPRASTSAAPPWVKVRAKVLDDLTSGASEDEDSGRLTKDIKGFFGDLKKSCERKMILDGTRVDGRKWDEIREITIVPNFIPRQHGSVLFTRGETQALVSATLGTPDDEQIIDGVEEEYRKNFYLHYNFPAYSVGETRRIMGPGRREIGHGMLAERALQSVVCRRRSRFPYTIRIVSDITESNGSSSMASVCGGCLSMMLAGVTLLPARGGHRHGPRGQDGKDHAILSDILGSEDHCGDMDFKVAGSGVGITALQMDIKVKGVSRDLLQRALEQAREGTHPHPAQDARGRPGARRRGFALRAAHGDDQDPRGEASAS